MRLTENDRGIRKQLLLSLMFLILSLASISSASAFALWGFHPPSYNPIPPTNPPPFLHWDLRTFAGCVVPYTINTAGTPDIANEFDAIDRAAKSWTDVQPSIAMLRRTPPVTTNSGFAGDDENVLSWFEAAPRTEGFTATTLAVTGCPHGDFDPNTGVVSEMDIVFNGLDYGWTTTGMNLRASLPQATSGNAQPYALVNGDTLTIRVDGGAVQTVTFRAADFVNIATATAEEVARVISAQTTGLDVFWGGGVVTLTSSPGGLNPYSPSLRVQVTGGTASGPAKLNFDLLLHQGVNDADVETIALHEFGHFLGLGHTSANFPEPNPALRDPVMYAYATMTKLALTQDDGDGLNYLYTPDLGDAPNPYPSTVHNGPSGRTLNGIALLDPATGAEHLYGYQPTGYAYEWLGDLVEMPTDTSECEAKIEDRDEHDDGVTFIGLTREWKAKFTVLVKVSTSGLGAARYTAGNRLYLNAWIDWNVDGVWTPFDKIIEWNGGPGLNDVCPTSNLKNPASPWPVGTNSRILEFEITVPLYTVPTYDIMKPLWSRFRLDYDENVGHANKYSDPALLNDKYAASFGEVEDYRPPSVGGYGVPVENPYMHSVLNVSLADCLIVVSTILAVPAVLVIARKKRSTQGR